MLWDDVRFALRSYRKNLGFILVAVLTIALGLGANTAIFSFLDGVLLRPVSYPEPERIVQLWEKPPGGTRNVISAANFLDWQKQNTVFQMIAASSGKTVTLSGGGTVPVAAGLVVGVIGALALTRLVQGLLFETSPTDPVTMVWVGLVLLLVALTACYLPARRAARVDAMTALRYE